MRNLVLFDDDLRTNLLPLSYTRPCCDLRVGILTIREKWEKYLQLESSTITLPYLQNKFPLNKEKENLFINSRLLPNDQILDAIEGLKFGQALSKNGVILAAFAERHDEIKSREVDFNCSLIDNCTDIFSKNAEELQADFDLITKGRTSLAIDPSNTVKGQESIFLEEGAKVSCSILNAESGPIYIGKNAEIMEGCVVRGGLAMNENSVLKLGAKIYGATTLGPFCKVGGEVNNSVLTGYSSKAHDGFLGNSVLGEWCNLGADTNNSNLKNNYAEVKLWNYQSQSFKKTGLQFCGLIMGDHSKSGINTMFNTGTVVGVSANIFGGGFPRNFIPSFSWGGSAGFTTYKMNKVKEVATKVMARRSKEFDENEANILNEVFEQSAQYRSWEKT